MQELDLRANAGSYGMRAWRSGHRRRDDGPRYRLRTAVLQQWEGLHDCSERTQKNVELTREGEASHDADENMRR